MTLATKRGFQIREVQKIVEAENTSITRKRKKEKHLRSDWVLWTPDSNAYEALGYRLTFISSEVSVTDLIVSSQMAGKSHETEIKRTAAARPKGGEPVSNSPISSPPLHVLDDNFWLRPGMVMIFFYELVQQC